jgi:hypothetical protein
MMTTVKTAWTPADGPVRYDGGNVEVHLGDRVELRGWFRRRQGTVNYVAGISEPHEEMEYGGLYWVGLALDSGIFTGALVDPDTGCTRKNLLLLDRGESSHLLPLPDAPWD